MLYVLDGARDGAVGGEAPLDRPGVGVFVARGTRLVGRGRRRRSSSLSVLVHDPEPVADGAHAVVDLAARGARASATAARQFMLGVTPDVGCTSVTQFIGFVPPGRAPDHFHRYDEVLYVLEGEGTLHIDGEEAPLAPGACVHLPARLVHCLENTGDERDAAARRLPARRARRPRPTTPTARPPSYPSRRTDMPRIERTAEIVWEGNLARGEGLDLGRHAARSPACRTRSRPASASPRARRAPRSCSRRRTAAASRCRSPAS